mmetsp:Transcript_6400/g.25865  ORF Transcript_6400/g.25865 Transcript_6400/m.25865 type:complete len:254 (-) Transcript_6400:1800-2561(-)
MRVRAPPAAAACAACPAAAACAPAPSASLQPRRASAKSLAAVALPRMPSAADAHACSTRSEAFRAAGSVLMMHARRTKAMTLSSGTKNGVEGANVSSTRKPCSGYSLHCTPALSSIMRLERPPSLPSSCRALAPNWNGGGRTKLHSAPTTRGASAPSSSSRKSGLSLSIQDSHTRRPSWVSSAGGDHAMLSSFSMAKSTGRTSMLRCGIRLARRAGMFKHVSTTYARCARPAGESRRLTTACSVPGRRGTNSA